MESCASLKGAENTGQEASTTKGEQAYYTLSQMKKTCVVSPPCSPSRADFHVHARSDCNGPSWSEKCARFVRLGPAPLECSVRCATSLHLRTGLPCSDLSGA